MRRSAILARRNKGRVLHPNTTAPLVQRDDSPAKVVKPTSATKPIGSDATLKKRVGIGRKRKVLLGSVNAPMKPPVLTPLDANKPKSNVVGGGEKSHVGHFMVLYTKRSNKKHKNYTDGVLSYSERVMTLRTMEDKEVVKRTVGFKPWELEVSALVELGNWEMELASTLDHDDFISGRVFVVGGSSKPPPPPTISRAAMKNGVKQPMKKLKKSIGGRNSSLKRAKPMYDPKIPTALVLNRDRLDGDDLCQGVEVPVVVEPQLSATLRPHQREGVQFLYNAVSGVSLANQYGVILGDEMGLGKTLQAITIIRTLLTQGPTGKALISKAIVVAPASLIGNWQSEFRRWLGSAKCKPVVLSPSDSQKKQVDIVKEFAKSRIKHVLIVGYEMIRKHVKVLQKLGDTLLVCDEGHRLKNAAGNQTIKALGSLNCKRRIIITGTPVQNDLQEFYAVCDFVCPGVFGTLKAFRNSFEAPIAKSREPGCSDREREKGLARSMELSRMTQVFVLRRTADVINKYLPCKHELVVLCRLSDLQSKVYRHYLRSKDIMGYLSQSKNESNPLMFITWLKKVCNHPALVYKGLAEDGNTTKDSSILNALQAFGEDTYDTTHPCIADSGKLLALKHILHMTTTTTKDKIVIISNYTETLNVIEHLCNTMSIELMRLDGATPANQRTSLVERFNATYSTIPVFLLSAKAGGVGLNLVGANRLVLFDPDWNPATDLQVMARVWRQGQKKVTWIYRLLGTGTIDEKIFQRQLRKIEVSDAVVDEQHDTKRKFTGESLKELFVFREDTLCETHDLLTNNGQQRNKRVGASATNVPMDSTWEFHEKCDDLADEALLKGVSNSVVSFVMHKYTDTDVDDINATIVPTPLSLSAKENQLTEADLEVASSAEMCNEDTGVDDHDSNHNQGDDEPVVVTKPKPKSKPKKEVKSKKRSSPTKNTSSKPKKRRRVIEEFDDDDDDDTLVPQTAVGGSRRSSRRSCARVNYAEMEEDAMLAADLAALDEELFDQFENEVVVVEDEAANQESSPLKKRRLTRLGSDDDEMEAAAAAPPPAPGAPTPPAATGGTMEEAHCSNNEKDDVAADDDNDEVFDTTPTSRRVRKPVSYVGMDSGDDDYDEDNFDDGFE